VRLRLWSSLPEQYQITERIREIATLKVVGFYARRWAHMSSRKFGADFARRARVFDGHLADSFVMGQLSFDMVSFHVVIKPLSYLLAVRDDVLLRLRGRHLYATR
jgi:putative ABC transport system permease protein